MDDKDSQGQGSPGKPFALRPSALSSSGGFGSQQENKPVLLRPSALSAIADQLDTNSEPKKRKTSEESEGASENEDGNKKIKVDHEPKSPSASLQLNENVVPPQGIGTFGFVNEDKNSNSTNNRHGNSGSDASAYRFVFGQNISERVTGFDTVSKADNSTEGDSFENAEEISEKELEQKLAENAVEHMKKEESSKIHLKEIEVVTGEEGERNVLQIQCKLHILCQEKSNWIEKGRGTLKLNDICKSEKDDIFQSRLVFRRQGSFQVVLNMLLWPQISYDKATSKSLRITAIDPDTEKINVYLITGTPKDITQLHTAIDRRVIALLRNTSDAGASASPEVISDSENNDSCEGATSNAAANKAEKHRESPILKDEETNRAVPAKDSSEQNDSGNSNDSSEHET